MSLSVIILAAGQGKRMISGVPKVLHPLGGIPMLERVVNTAQSLNPDSIVVVYGNGGEQVCETLNYLPVKWALQKEQLGTGHAVMQALPYCGKDDRVLVLLGDVPLISETTLARLLDETPPNGVGLVVAEMDDPTGLGRIVRNDLGNVISIVEHKDASDELLKIKEINTGIMTASSAHLRDWMPRLKNTNQQAEYYLTDIVALAVEDGFWVGGIRSQNCEEVQGVNDRWQLATLERYYQRMLARNLTEKGVTIMDPDRLDIRGQVEIAQDVTLDVNIVLEGVVKIGHHSHIGSNVYLKDVEIGEHVEIKPNSVIEGARLESFSKIGPFARIREGTMVQSHAKVGNFIELKNTQIGRSSKANHVGYLGDATIGENANIGAGTIVCNYDGKNKHKTEIGDNVFVGSNTSLVAPLTIEENAFIGAGSTITSNVEKNALAIGRVRQRVVKHWKSRTK